jgi:hypothetical protein
MNAFKKDHFSERLTSAAKAKTAMLERFRARPGPDDPVVIERRAAQEAVEAAREIRVAERKAAREAEAIKQAAEQAAQAAEAQAKAVEQAARKAEDVAREAALAVERKAARDAKYAARIARRR